MKLFRLFFALIFVMLFDKGRSLLAQKPNIIIIIADDLGYGELGCYGSKDIKSPNIDRLANEGVRLTNFYANSAECTPTRVAILTGKYQQRVGGLECAIGMGNIGRYDEAIWLAAQKELGLPSDYSTLTKELKISGYNTANIGKWHLGYEEKFRPVNHFFDYSLGPLGYGGDYFYHVEQFPFELAGFTGAHTLARNGKEIFRPGYYSTHLFTDEAKAWINKQSSNKPFFLFLTYTAPHFPYQGSEDYNKDVAWKMQNRETYVNMVTEMDRGIGEIVEILERKNLDQNTIVVFISDNGGIPAADNGIFRGHKGLLYEGGIRVPCIIRWPGKIAKNTVSDQMAIGFDLTYSSLVYAGADTDELLMDGFDIINHVVNKRNNINRTLYWRYKRENFIRKAIREGDMKYLIEYSDNKEVYRNLFNIKMDPTESRNLTDSLPDLVETLHKKIIEWEKMVESPRLADFNKN